MKPLAIYIFAALLFSLNILSAQESCLPGGIILKTQQDVDNFLINFPNCNRILNNVVIEENSSIYNLQGLKNVTYIGGSLTVIQSNSLSNFKGLDNLATIRGSLIIQNNESLENFEGFENLTQIDGSLEIEDNPQITNLIGFENLEEINYRLFIKKNARLRNLIGLEKLNSIASPSIFDLVISIAENDSLISLEGLGNISQVYGAVQIIDNQQLTTLTTFEKLGYIDGYLNISNNPNLKKAGSFSGLKSMNGGLYLRNNQSINDLSSFDSLRLIKGLAVSNCDLLHDLQGLGSLLQIDGTFEIAENKNLINLNGVEKLDKISDIFYINENSKLENFMGLESLESVGDFKIFENLILQDFSGLENLVTINGDFLIMDNSFLNNFNGLNNVNFMGGELLIENNRRLDNIDGISNVDATSFKPLKIKNCSSLSKCEITSICNYLNDTNFYAEIFNNNPGCNSRDEISDNCKAQLGQLKLLTFFDLNQDRIHQTDEIIFDGLKMQVLPIGFFFNQAFLPFGTYNVLYQEQPNWKLTSLNEQVEIRLDENNKIDTVKFGIFPTVNVSESNNLITSQRTRCHDKVQFEVSTQNTGTTTISKGTLVFEIDSQISEVDYIDLPTSIINPNLIEWEFNELLPSQSIKKKLILTIPGPPDFPIGNPLNFNSYSNFEDINGNLVPSNFTYKPIVRCSYDPNDKLVSPDRDFKLTNPDRIWDLTLFEEPLTYTIRFQNTGNDYAENVSIKDTLDLNLDLSSFKVLGSSHYEILSTFVKDERFISFDFNDIFLPDSTADLDESQGFVTYQIMAKENLPEETFIKNTASIYFDQNPTIVTNTTENTMVSMLPTSSTQSINNQLNVTLYPNPTTGKIYLSDNNLQKAKITVTDLTGRILLVKKLNGSNEIDLSANAKGMLFVKIETEEGVAVNRILKK